MARTRTPEPPVEIGIQKTTSVAIAISQAKLQEIIFDWLNQGLVKDGKAPAPISKEAVEVSGNVGGDEQLDGISVQYRIHENG